jgi:hypothetical protein
VRPVLGCARSPNIYLFRLHRSSGYLRADYPLWSRWPGEPQPGTRWLARPAIAASIRRWQNPAARRSRLGEDQQVRERPVGQRAGPVTVCQQHANADRADLQRDSEHCPHIQLKGSRCEHRPPLQRHGGQVRLQHKLTRCPASWLGPAPKVNCKSSRPTLIPSVRQTSSPTPPIASTLTAIPDIPMTCAHNRAVTSARPRDPL